MKKYINKIQNRILATTFPLATIIIALGVAENIFDTGGRGSGRGLDVHWYYFEYTWKVWLLAIILISIFEFWFFRNK